MSISPSGLFSASILCNRSASQAPPVYRPTMPVFAPMRGLSSATSCSHSFSASGSLVKVLLQDELRGHRIDRFVLQATQLGFRFYGGVALVHARHRQLEALLEAPREILGLLRHLVRFALYRGRQADHEA